MSNYTPESFSVFKAYSLMCVAELYLADIINSGHVHAMAKDRFRMAQRRIKANINDLRFCVPEDARKILDEQMLNDEITLQMENIFALLASLPKGIRDQIEATVEAHAKVYMLNHSSNGLVNTPAPEARP